MVDPKKASELANVYTASDLVDADIRFGVDDSTNALSAQLSLAELKKTGVQVINVKQYGATGDGVADSTTAIQAAIDAAAGQVVFFPPGTYKCTSGLTLPDNVILRGAHRLATILKYTGTGVFIQRVSGVTTGVGIENLTIEGTDGSGGTGLKLDSFSRCHFKQVTVNMFRNAGNTGLGIQCNNTDGVFAFNYFEDIEIANCDDSLVMDSTNATHSVGYSTFNRLVISTEVRGIRMLSTLANGSIYNQFLGLFFQNSGSTTHCIELAGSGNAFHDVTVDGSPSTYVLDLMTTTTSGNYFRFITGWDTAKYNNAWTTGASNTIFTGAQFPIAGTPRDGAVGGYVQYLEPTGDADFRITSGGTDSYVELNMGNSSATKQWTFQLNNSSNPAIALISDDTTTQQRWYQTGQISLFGNFSGDGTQTIFIKDSAAVPSSNPTGGGLLYVEAGALKYRGSSGTVTTLGPA